MRHEKPPVSLRGRWIVEGAMRMPALLIVDDFPPMLKIMRSQLAEIGLHDVDSAMSAGDALSAFHRRDYDLLIVDYYLGDRTGHDLVSALARSAEHCDTPSIIITGEPDRATRDLGFAVDWLRKPFTSEELLERIEATCPHWTRLG